MATSSSATPACTMQAFSAPIKTFSYPWQTAGLFPDSCHELPRVRSCGIQHGQSFAKKRTGLAKRGAFVRHGRALYPFVVGHGAARVLCPGNAVFRVKAGQKPAAEGGERDRFRACGCTATENGGRGGRHRP